MVGIILEVDWLAVTNNLAERTVKPYIIARKNFLFSCTEKGAH
ncbi:MAG: transposase, partial [Ruminococcus sp.]|nr:transposase [Ruminococcus sp.]